MNPKLNFKQFTNCLLPKLNNQLFLPFWVPGQHSTYLHHLSNKNLFAVSQIEKIDQWCFFQIWRIIKTFLNFQNFTSHVLKNPKISLVFLIRPFLIRPYCVYGREQLSLPDSYSISIAPAIYLHAELKSVNIVRFITLCKWK